MSLIDRIKKARAKAEKLSGKAEKAKSKGKDKRFTRLEKRSEKKSGKADKLTGKLGAKVAAASLKATTFKPSTYMMGTSFGTGLSNISSSDSSDKPLKEPKDTSRKESYKMKPRKKQ